MGSINVLQVTENLFTNTVFIRFLFLMISQGKSG